MTKRLFDIAAAALGLLVLAPIMAILAVGVLVSMGRPVLFRQVRAGLGGRDFTLVKFRSMRSAMDRDGMPLPDEERVTEIGRVLRRFRFDELPESTLR